MLQNNTLLALLLGDHFMPTLWLLHMSLKKTEVDRENFQSALQKLGWKEGKKKVGKT